MELEERQHYRAWAQIDLKALDHNVRTVQAMLPPQTRYMAVVKANAYGHGDEAICKRLWTLGVRWFAVSNLEEALAVRSYCPYSEIFILGYTPPAFAPELARHNIIQGVVSLDYAYELAGFAHQPVRCHIKLDTGMGRIGFRGQDAQSLAQELEPLFALPALSVEGLYTHFAVADSDDPEDIAYTDMQEKLTVDTYDALAANGHRLMHLHFMNSAASVRRPNPRATLARVGIIMYGLEPNYPLHVPMELRPVMSLHSVVSHVKTVGSGVSISYGRTYTTDRTRTIATVTIGYADGYARLLSGKTQVLLHGVRCPQVGRICMDQLMIDVTGVPQPVQPGDEVTLIGTDGGETITADELAALYGTIGYEVVCGISKRVPRCGA